jgi:uncharacterized protein
MQNLRDKLLKAGLVTEQEAREAERKAGKPQGTIHHKQQAQSEEERQRREAERALRLRQLVEANRVREPPGEVNFHFVKRSGKVGRLAVSPETAKLLESGAAAVVEDPGNPEHAVVPGEAAKRIYEVDKQAVRFWFGPEKPIGFELD